MKKCVFDEGKNCINCQKCNLCDLDESKICDNCMKCVYGDGESYNSIVMENVKVMTEEDYIKLEKNLE